MYAYTPAYLRGGNTPPEPPTAIYRPFRMRQRDDKYGISSAPRLESRNFSGGSKATGIRIGLNNNYQ